MQINSPSPNIYMDYAATTPLDERVWQAMDEARAEAWANPSSLHSAGARSKELLEEARQQVLSLLDAPEAAQLIWTSHGTEANNLALLGLAQSEQAKTKRHLISTPIEHSAVLKPLQWLAAHQGFELTLLAVEPDGRVLPETLAQALRPDTLLLSLGHGNNEVGTLQDLETLGALAQAAGVLVHTDAVQTVGKVPLSLKHLPVDYLSASAHKFYGPRGIGFLYCAPNAPLPCALQWGGGQEQGVRAGTVNTLGAIGTAKALALCLEQQEEEAPRLRRLASYFKMALHNKAEKEQAGLSQLITWHGCKEVMQRLPGLVSLSLPPLEGEAMVLQLDLQGIAASSGSACNSQKVEGSPVLKAMGASDAVASSMLRFSMGRFSSKEEVDAVITQMLVLLKKAARKQRKP
jgi:cysteine desulfurase